MGVSRDMVSRDMVRADHTKASSSTREDTASSTKAANRAFASHEVHKQERQLSLECHVNDGCKTSNVHASMLA